MVYHDLIITEQIRRKSA